MAKTKEQVIVSGRKRGKAIVFAFLAPAFILYLVFFIYPTVDAFRISLYNWSGFNFASAKFIGLDNFKVALTDKWLWLALSNNIMIMVFGGLLMFTSALFFAAVLTTPGFRGRSFYKTVIFLPYVLNQVAVALFWILVLQPRWGMLNTALREIGLGALAQAWLGSRGLGMASIILVIVWYDMGFYMILLMAGIETIPMDLYDAAKVDGASSIQTFRYLTLPLLRDILSIAVILWMINAIQQFGVVWALTRGEPGMSTNTISTYMMQNAFPNGNVGGAFHLGYATALAVILFILVFGLSLLFFRLQRKEAVEY